MNMGFIYAAFGEKYVKEAIFSLKSLRKYHKNAHVTIFTDSLLEDHHFNKIIILKSTKSYLDKINAIRQSTYQNNIFLDTDTYICEPINDAFGLLKYYDICMVPELGRPCWENIPNGLEELKELNTGVILFNLNARVKKLLKDWENIYKERMHFDFHDQTSMAIALAFSNARLGLLPSEYNLRAIHPQTLYRRVKIIHSRHRNYQMLQKAINKFDASRNWIPSSEKCIHIRGTNYHLFKKSVKNFLRPIIKIIRNIFNLHGDLIMEDKDRFED